MQVLCKSSKDAAEIRCSVCGQGFALYWERQSKTERTLAMKDVASALRKHHNTHAGPEAHPNCGFLVQSAIASLTFSGAANLGNAPSWAL